MKRWMAPLGGALLLFVLGMIWGWAGSRAPERALANGLEAPLEAPLEAKPIYNWWVCEDLGVGAVPGVSGLRQRFRLCHHQDWEVLAYCTQPGLPAPSLGERCTRISNKTYQCGAGVQIIREYAILDTPAPSPTITSTPGPNDTPTPTVTATSPAPTPTNTPSVTVPAPSATAPPRARPGDPAGAPADAPTGGAGIFQRIFPFLLGNKPTATPTPFLPMPITPTPVLPLAQPPALPQHAEPAPGFQAAPPLDFYGIDFGNTRRWVRIRILPRDKRVNDGKPIVMAFLPGGKCVFGDNHACVTGYQGAGQAAVTFLSIHSGNGGEAEALRRALEGAGPEHAAYSLKRVLANLRALEGAQVVITQGKMRYKGFVLAAAGRVPPRSLQAYFKAPLSAALAQAAADNPDLATYISPAQPLLIFETCGWYIPGEKGGRGTTETSASVYLGVIIRAP